MLSILSCVCWSSAFLLWKNVYSVLCPFCNQIVCFFMQSCMNCLYMLNINPFQSYHLQIFFPFSRLSFLLSIAHITMQKFLSFIRSLFFFFYFLYFRRWIQKENIAVIYVKKCSAYVFVQELNQLPFIKDYPISCQPEKHLGQILYSEKFRKI